MSKFLKFNDKLYSLVDSAEEIESTSEQPQIKADEVESVKDTPAEIIAKIDNLMAELTAEVEKLKSEIVK